MLSLCNPGPTKTSSTITKQTDTLWYRGILGKITIQTKSRHTKIKRSRAVGELPVVKEGTWTIRPSFLSYVVEMRYKQSFGQISRSLNIYPMLDRNEPVFKMCWDGDIAGLQVALSSGGISPFVSDKDGCTLLHVSPLILRLGAQGPVLITASMLP
jgi:hypothetical protein